MVVEASREARRADGVAPPMSWPVPAAPPPPVELAELACRLADAIFARRLTLAQMSSFLGAQGYIRGTCKCLPPHVLVEARVKLRRTLVEWRSRTLLVAEAYFAWRDAHHGPGLGRRPVGDEAPPWVSDAHYLAKMWTEMHFAPLPVLADPFLLHWFHIPLRGLDDGAPRQSRDVASASAEQLLSADWWFDPIDLHEDAELRRMRALEPRVHAELRALGLASSLLPSVLRHPCNSLGRELDLLLHSGSTLALGAQAASALGPPGPRSPRRADPRELEPARGRFALPAAMVASAAVPAADAGRAAPPKPRARLRPQPQQPRPQPHRSRPQRPERPAPSTTGALSRAPATRLRTPPSAAPALLLRASAVSALGARPSQLVPSPGTCASESGWGSVGTALSHAPTARPRTALLHTGGALRRTPALASIERPRTPSPSPARALVLSSAPRVGAHAHAGAAAAAAWRTPPLAGGSATARAASPSASAATPPSAAPAPRRAASSRAASPRAPAAPRAFVAGGAVRAEPSQPSPPVTLRPAAAAPRRRLVRSAPDRRAALGAGAPAAPPPRAWRLGVALGDGRGAVDVPDSYSARIALYTARDAAASLLGCALRWRSTRRRVAARGCERRERAARRLQAFYRSLLGARREAREQGRAAVRHARAAVVASALTERLAAADGAGRPRTDSPFTDSRRERLRRRAQVVGRRWRALRACVEAIRSMAAAAVRIQKLARAHRARRALGGLRAATARRAPRRADATEAAVSARFVALQSRFRARRALDLALCADYARVLEQTSAAEARALRQPADGADGGGGGCLADCARALRACLEAAAAEAEAALARAGDARGALAAAELRASRLRGRVELLLALQARARVPSAAGRADGERAPTPAAGDEHDARAAAAAESIEWLHLDDAVRERADRHALHRLRLARGADRGLVAARSALRAVAQLSALPAAPSSAPALALDWQPIHEGAAAVGLELRRVDGTLAALGALETGAPCVASLLLGQRAQLDGVRASLAHASARLAELLDTHDSWRHASPDGSAALDALGVDGGGAVEDAAARAAARAHVDAASARALCEPAADDEASEALARVLGRCRDRADGRIARSELEADAADGCRELARLLRTLPQLREAAAEAAAAEGAAAAAAGGLGLLGCLEAHARARSLAGLDGRRRQLDARLALAAPARAAHKVARAARDRALGALDELDGCRAAEAAMPIPRLELTLALPLSRLHQSEVFQKACKALADGGAAAAASRAGSPLSGREAEAPPQAGAEAGAPRRARAASTRRRHGALELGLGRLVEAAREHACDDLVCWFGLGERSLSLLGARARHETEPTTGSTTLLVDVSLRLHHRGRLVSAVGETVAAEFENALHGGTSAAFVGLATALGTSVVRGFAVPLASVAMPSAQSAPARGHLEAREAALADALAAAAEAVVDRRADVAAAAAAEAAAPPRRAGGGGEAAAPPAARLLFRDWQDLVVERLRAQEAAGARPAQRAARDAYRAAKRAHDELSGRLDAVRALRAAPNWPATLRHPADSGAVDSDWNLGYASGGCCDARGQMSQGRFCAFCAALEPPALARHPFLSCPRRHASAVAEWDGDALERLRSAADAAALAADRELGALAARKAAARAAKAERAQLLAVRAELRVTHGDERGRGEAARGAPAARQGSGSVGSGMVSLLARPRAASRPPPPDRARPSAAGAPEAGAPEAGGPRLPVRASISRTPCAELRALARDLALAALGDPPGPAPQRPVCARGGGARGGAHGGGGLSGRGGAAGWARYREALALLALQPSTELAHAPPAAAAGAAKRAVESLSGAAAAAAAAAASLPVVSLSLVRAVATRCQLGEGAGAEGQAAARRLWLLAEAVRAPLKPSAGAGGREPRLAGVVAAAFADDDAAAEAAAPPHALLASWRQARPDAPRLPGADGGARAPELGARFDLVHARRAGLRGPGAAGAPLPPACDGLLAYVLLPPAAGQGGAVSVCCMRSGARFASLQDLPELRRHSDARLRAASRPAQRAAAGASFGAALHGDGLLARLEQMRARELASGPLRSASLAARPRPVVEVALEALRFGVDARAEPELLWLFDVALGAQVPAGWTEVEIGAAELELERARASPLLAALLPAAKLPKRGAASSGATDARPRSGGVESPRQARAGLERLGSPSRRFSRQGSGASAAGALKPPFSPPPPPRAVRPLSHAVTVTVTYYHNALTGRSQWLHPIDAYVHREIKQWRHPRDALPHGANTGLQLYAL